jgi:hypothetical protein
VVDRDTERARRERDRRQKLEKQRRARLAKLLVAETVAVARSSKKRRKWYEPLT